MIAYSTCISHGIDMTKSMAHQKEAVRSGYWNLYRYQPTKSATGQPFNLDSKEPSLPVREFVMSEARYAILSRTDPARAELLMELAQADIDERWRYYRQLAAIERSVAVEAGNGSDVDDQIADKEDQS